MSDVNWSEKQVEQLIEGFLLALIREQQGREQQAREQDAGASA